MDSSQLTAIAQSYRDRVQTALHQGATSLRIQRVEFPERINQDLDLFWKLMAAFREEKVRVQVPGGFHGATEVILHWDAP